MVCVCLFICLTFAESVMVVGLWKLDCFVHLTLTYSIHISNLHTGCEIIYSNDIIDFAQACRLCGSGDSTRLQDFKKG